MRAKDLFGEDLEIMDEYFEKFIAEVERKARIDTLKHILKGIPVTSEYHEWVKTNLENLVAILGTNPSPLKRNNYDNKTWSKTS